MKKSVVNTFWIFLIVCSTIIAQQRPRDYFFMIDVTGSMIGKGDGKGIDIFDDVKRWVIAYIDQMKTGEALIIYPFERGLKNSDGSYFKGIIQNNQDKDAAKKFVDNLKATGQSTWLTESYQTLLQNMGILSSLIDGYDKSRREQIIVIYTDGKGNGPADIDIENFIRQYEFIKNDYEYLLTKFFVIGQVNNEINQADKDKLEKRGIDVTIIDRNKTAQLVTLQVSPNSLVAYDYNPKFSIQISNVPDSLNGHLINLQLNFENQIPCLFDYNPKQISLDNNKIYDITLDFRQSEQCLRFLKSNKIDSLRGILSLDSRSEFIVFSPSSIIEFNYLFEPINLILYPISSKLNKDNKEINLGFTVEGNEFLKNEYKINLTGFLSKNPDIEFNIVPKEITLSKDIDTFWVKLNVSDDKYSHFIDSLKSEFQDTFRININSLTENPNLKIDDTKLKYVVAFYPIKEPIFLYILIGLIVLLLIAYLICKFRTAHFNKGAKLEYEDSAISGMLIGKFCKPYLTAGDTPRDDIKISKFSTFQETLIKIKSGVGEQISVLSNNPLIKLLDSSDSESEMLLLNPGDKFFILHDSEKIELFYNI